MPEANRLQYWLMSIRPKTLPASIAPVILGLALAHADAVVVNPLTATLTLLCALLMQVGTNLVNDYFDGVRGVDNEARLGPARATAQGLIAPEQVRRAYRIVFFLSFLLGTTLMYLGGWPIVVIGLSSLATAYLYTAGPFPLAYYALGEVLALIFFGPIAVAGTYYIQVLTFPDHVILAGLGPGLLAACIMAINNLRDLYTDRETRKKTLAIFLGEAGARKLCLAFLLLAGLIPLMFAQFQYQWHWLYLLPALAGLIFLPKWQQLMKAPLSREMNLVLAATGQYLFLYCVLFSVSVLLP